MARPDGRQADELRRVKLVPDFIGTADGSVLVELGRTRVVCTAMLQAGVPRWLQGRGTGWVTAEYGMLPASAGRRMRRDGPWGVDSRGTEIRRLIGRALRAVVDLAALGENTFIVDCDVLEADGGTRTAAITGGWVALARAVDRARADGRLVTDADPIADQVAAVSCGLVDGEARLDLAYEEDSAAEVDMNVAMTPAGRLIEVQATGEGATFTGSEMVRLVRLAHQGCKRLAEAQAQARRKRRRRGGRRRGAGGSP
jgi:ribonuclease PH